MGQEKKIQEKTKMLTKRKAKTEALIKKLKDLSTKDIKRVSVDIVAGKKVRSLYTVKAYKTKKNVNLLRKKEELLIELEISLSELAAQKKAA